MDNFDLCLCSQPPRCPNPSGRPYPLARLNVWANDMAKQELHRIAALPQNPAVPTSLLGEWWYAQVPPDKITSDPHSMVVDLLGQREALRYWSHKQQLDAHSFDLVHWESIDKATQSFPPMLQRGFPSLHLAILQWWW